MNKFKNIFKYLNEAKLLDDEWEQWREAEIDMDQFSELELKHNNLCEKVALAFYEDTKEYNSLEDVTGYFLWKTTPNGLCHINPLELILKYTK